jgi:hypothetical protein
VISDNFVTVAGQTAPGKGIIVTGFPFGVSGAEDVVIRHIVSRDQCHRMLAKRFVSECGLAHLRDKLWTVYHSCPLLGDCTNDGRIGMGLQGSNHAIIDRSSISWTIDESFSSRSAYNITLQRTMISEPLNVAGHQNYPAGTAHGYAASISGNIGSFHHNLIAHAWGRSWSMAGGLDDLGNFSGRLDIRNNVVYNFGEPCLSILTYSISSSVKRRSRNRRWSSRG